MIVKVVGVTFENKDGSSRADIISRMSNTDKVCLERDPYNEYDSNAVKVLVMRGDEKKQIGYLPKDIAAKISPKLRRNVDFMVTVSRVGVWKHNPFCEIDIVEILTSSDVEDKVSSGSATPTFRPRRPVAGPTFTPPSRRKATTLDESSMADNNEEKPSVASPTSVTRPSLEETTTNDKIEESRERKDLDSGESKKKNYFTKIYDWISSAIKRK